MTTHTDRTATDREERAAATASVPAAQLFVVLQCDDLRAAPSRHALSHVDEVRLGRGEMYAATRSVEAGLRILDLRLPDPRMSRSHARLVRSAQGFQLHDLGSSNGMRVDGARCASAELGEGTSFELGQTLFRLRLRLPTPAQAAGDVRIEASDSRPPVLHTLLPELEASFARLVRVARSLVPVVLLGETGTGKEWFARAVHDLSGRPGAFVALNCGALPANLLESLLFGHVRGAFSGATRDEPGHVRAADGGSLFLDEIGDLPAASQTALLRVLQEREVVPVGSTRAIAVDLRVLSATHAELMEQAEAGSFRNDLYARLSGFTFHTPALRERSEDLGLILRTLAPELEQAAGGSVRLSAEAARWLLSRAWPRNIRELKQCLVAACVLADSGSIELSHLSHALARPPAANSARARDSGDGDPSDEARHTELLRLFREHRGNVTQVARALGKARVQVQRWMKRFDIDPDKFRE